MNPGNTTTDKVFLLSIAEVEKYLPSTKAKRTERLFDVVAGRNVFDPWWLRTVGHLVLYLIFRMGRKNVQHLLLLLALFLTEGIRRIVQRVSAPLCGSV